MTFRWLKITKPWIFLALSCMWSKVHSGDVDSSGPAVRGRFALSTERESPGDSAPTWEYWIGPGPPEDSSSKTRWTLGAPGSGADQRNRIFSAVVSSVDHFVEYNTSWKVNRTINKNVLILKTECLVCKTECILFNIRASELVRQTFPFSSKGKPFYSMLLLFSVLGNLSLCDKITFFS